MGSVHWSECSGQYLLTSECAVCNKQCTVLYICRTQFAVWSLQCTVRIVCSLKCTVYRVQCTVYSVLSIYKFGLSVCLSVCLFVSNKRQNGWTDQAQIFCGTSRDHREGLWMIKILNICLHQNSIFLKASKKYFTKKRRFRLSSGVSSTCWRPCSAPSRSSSALFTPLNGLHSRRDSTT